MSKLSAFLKPTPEGKKKEVILERFTDENGKVVPFVIKSIRAADNDSLVRKNTDRKTGKFNSTTYSNQLIVACMVEPDLRSTEICDYYGTIDPNDVPGLMFTIGEKQIIQDAILEINDVNSAQDRLDAAKNS
ncbi:MAG: hypothetical protein HFG50_08805 [Lachnospiraceae bacterium]|nr:hypothetical protein [Lachnospiraceae bacterium]